MLLIILVTPLWADEQQIIVTSEVTTEVETRPSMTAELASIILPAAPKAIKLDYWQEFDLTFWQSLPFAFLWGHIFERQIKPSTAANWNAIGVFAVSISAWNAFMHARRVMDYERERQSH